MKTLFLTFALGAAGIALTACQPTATNTNSAANRSNMNMSGNMNMGGNASTMNSAANQNSIASNQSMMKSSPDAASQPYDLQFIDTMSEHHRSAIAMAKMAVEKTQNPELKSFAQKIIADQEKENAQMKGWRDKWFAGKPMAMNMEMPGMMGSMQNMETAMMKLRSSSGKEFDLAFLEAMTPHHAAAVQMSKDALTKAARPEIKTLAQNIIKAQEQEIQKMQAWKTAWSK